MTGGASDTHVRPAQGIVRLGVIERPLIEPDKRKGSALVIGVTRTARLRRGRLVATVESCIRADVGAHRTMARDAQSRLGRTVESLVTGSATTLQVRVALREGTRRHEPFDNSLRARYLGRRKQRDRDEEPTEAADERHLVKMNRNDVDKRRQDEHEEQRQVQHMPCRK